MYTLFRGAAPLFPVTMDLHNAFVIFKPELHVVTQDQHTVINRLIVKRLTRGLIILSGKNVSPTYVHLLGEGEV